MLHDDTDGTVGAVAGAIDCCAACRGFDPRTEHLIVWPIDSCSEFGCLCTYITINAPTIQELLFLVFRNVFIFSKKE